jgi:hypothetical protein
LNLSHLRPDGNDRGFIKSGLSRIAENRLSQRAVDFGVHNLAKILELGAADAHHSARDLAEWQVED